MLGSSYLWIQRQNVATLLSGMIDPDYQGEIELVLKNWK